MDKMSEENLLAYRVEKLEETAVSHQKSLDILMRAMWMMLGAIGFTQVILPIVERMT